MSDQVSITQEQAEIIEASVQPALDILMSSGDFPPTLYVHDGEQIASFTLEPQDVGALQEAARQIISESAPETLAYALLYDSVVETEDGQTDMLVIETGDDEDEEAHEFAWMYSREEGTVASQMGRLGPAPHLLK